MADPDIDEFYMPKSTRTGITQLAAAVGAYYVGHKRSQVFFVQPVEAKAQEFANDYLTPAFNDSPFLSGIVRHPTKGERQDTWDVRLYNNGGMWRLGWASSDGTFRGRTAQILMGDEWDDDGWSPSSEKSQGDKAKLFLDRGKTRAGSKLIMWSSPLRRKTSRIWPAFLKTDQQYYFVPCPHEGCGHMQKLEWGGRDGRHGIKPHFARNADGTEGELIGAVYVCIECEQPIADDRKTREWMDQNGEWRATEVAKKKRTRGMHISALYSMAPKVSWTSLWLDWIDAQGDPDALKHFFNSNLGLPWDDVVVDQRADHGSFAETRPEPYRGVVPKWARVLTAGIDTQRGKDDPSQKDWLPPRHEIQVVAWGAGEEAAVIGYYILPATVPFDQEAKAALDEIIFRKWMREDGREMQIATAAFDCSFMIDSVLTYCQHSTRARVCVPVRGENETTEKLAPIIISKPGVHAQTGRQFVNIGTRAAKNALSERLRRETPGPGYVHFPSSLQAAMLPGYDYFKGLFAERSFRDRKGVLHWERIAGKNTGEPWDTFVYALAAVRIAMSRHPSVARAIRDQTPREIEDRYDGEDKSAMAELMMEMMISKGTGKAEDAPETVSVPARTYAPPPVFKAPRRPTIIRSSIMG